MLFTCWWNILFIWVAFKCDREGSINTALEGGKQDLALLRRQASIGQMYPGDRSVMEN